MRRGARPQERRQDGAAFGRVSAPSSETQTLEREVRPEELLVLLEVRAGEAEGLLGAGLGALADRLAVGAGKVLGGLLSAGASATRKTVSHSTAPGPASQDEGRTGDTTGLLRLTQATHHDHARRATTHALCKPRRGLRAAGGMG